MFVTFPKVKSGRSSKRSCVRVCIANKLPDAADVAGPQTSKAVGLKFSHKSPTSNKNTGNIVKLKGELF